MTVAYSDAWLTIHGGDCRDVLPTLSERSVHCVVTSYATPTRFRS